MELICKNILFSLEIPQKIFWLGEKCTNRLPHLYFDGWPLDGLDSGNKLASLALLFCLSVSLPPSSEKWKLLVRVIYALKLGIEKIRAFLQQLAIFIEVIRFKGFFRTLYPSLIEAYPVFSDFM